MPQTLTEDERWMMRVRDSHAEWDAVRYAKLSAAGYIREARRLRHVAEEGNAWAARTAYSTLVRAMCWRAEAQRLASMPEHIGKRMHSSDVDWYVHTAWADRLRVYL